MARPQHSASIILWVLLAVCAALPLRSRQAFASYDETFVITGSINADQISHWSSLAGTRDYWARLDDPAAIDLTLLNQLQGAKSVTVETSSFPNDDTLAAWRALAAKGIQFISSRVYVPNDDDIARINSIGFKNCSFSFTYYPDPADAQRLSQLNCASDFGFYGDSYPKYAEIPGVKALPGNPENPISFNIDFWPYYSHMDALNLLPRDVTLWVRGMFPPPDELDYLHHIQRLKKITLETTFDPDSPKSWNEYGNVPVEWRSQDHMPELDQLNAFQQGGPKRNFILETDRPLNPDELERLQTTSIPVRWIHEAP